MLLDLDRFKEVNDTLGHHYGDELLRDLGPRLAETIGPDGLVARLGGDEFAVLPGDNTSDSDELEAIAEQLIRCVQQPVLVDEMTLEVGVSIGVARFPRDGEDPHSLLRSADVAMYAAKEAHAGCKVYAAALDRHSVRRLSVLSEFRRALDSDEIVVFYQPIMHMDGARVHGAEALVRWQHPELGLLPPSDFIGIVEQTGLIGPLTRHVLERAIAQCAGWRQAGRNLTVSVNLSVRNLLDPDLPALIGDLLALYGLAPEALQLEITESMLMSDPDRSLVTLTRLAQLGVGTVGRRLRHGLLVAGQPAPPADRRAQDRPLVRFADAERRKRPDHRPLDDQPGSRSRAEGGRRRSGGRGHPDPSGWVGLRLRPGLPLQQAPRPGRVHPLDRYSG